MGSVTLVAAVIPVPDEASQALMLDFHRHRTAGNSAAEALRLARSDRPADDIAARGFVCFGAG